MWLVLGPVAWVGLMVCSVELAVSFKEEARPLSRFAVVPAHVGAFVVFVCVIGTVLGMKELHRSVFEFLVHSDPWALPVAGLLVVVFWACAVTGMGGGITEVRDGHYYVVSGGVAEEITHERFLHERALDRRNTAAIFCGLYVPGATLGYCSYWLTVGRPSEASRPTRARHRRHRGLR
jgi:hypothetical protein